MTDQVGNQNVRFLMTRLESFCVSSKNYCHLHVHLPFDLCLLKDIFHCHMLCSKSGKKTESKSTQYSNEKYLLEVEIRCVFDDSCKIILGSLELPPTSLRQF